MNRSPPNGDQAPRASEQLHPTHGGGDRNPPVGGAGLTGVQAGAARASEIRDAASGAQRTSRPAVPVGLSRLQLGIEVVWDDIANARADVVAVGHYHGVYPTASEGAIDQAISGDDRSGERVLGVATTRGVLAGVLGEVSLFPWERRDGGRSTVAVVGLGRPGTFGIAEHELLIRNLLWTAEATVGASTLDCALIGSGSGNLSISEALESFIRSIDVAVREREIIGRLRTIRIMENELGRARRILTTLDRLLAARDGAAVRIDLGADLVTGKDGSVSDESALLQLLLLAAADRDWSKQTIDAVDPSPAVCAAVAKRLDGLTQARLRDFEVLPRRGAESSSTSTRLSVLVRDGELWASAISDTATVPERRLGLELELFEALVKEVALEAGADLERAGALLLRLAVPSEFRPLLRRGRSTVLEVDRHTAALPWEILAADGGGPSGRYLGLSTPLARQLRTTHSRPSVATKRATLRRVLVIADPGLPGGGGRLPGALAEAARVVSLLDHERIDFDFLAGPRGEAPVANSDGPATVATVLHHLVHHEYDIVHYAGHGQFSSEDAATASGWTFADGVLKASHLTMVERLPLVVVANACHSGRMSTGLPGLADEFIGKGVRNLIGTARAVDDASAIEFAEAFYRVLLSGSRPDPSACTLGDAVLSGRRKLSDRDLQDWDAYQLYGDPEFRFAPANPAR